MNRLQKSRGRDKARPSTVENRRFSKAMEGHVSSWPSFPGLLQLAQIYASLRGTADRLSKNNTLRRA